MENPHKVNERKNKKVAQFVKDHGTAVTTVVSKAPLYELPKLDDHRGGAFVTEPETEQLDGAFESMHSSISRINAQESRMSGKGSGMNS